MSKTKSISDLVIQLQQENEQAQFLNKLFGQAVKHEFGYSVEELHELLLKYSVFEKKYYEQEQRKQGQQAPIPQSGMETRQG